jgi:hypothetical protein
MTKDTIDMRRGMAAQKATELRRLLSEVAANEGALRIRQWCLSSGCFHFNSPGPRGKNNPSDLALTTACVRER